MGVQGYFTLCIVRDIDAASIVCSTADASRRLKSGTDSG